MANVFDTDLRSAKRTMITEVAEIVGITMDNISELKNSKPL
jgi:DNA-binding Xre family transcriptional regulator